MKMVYRITSALIAEIRRDLQRPHRFAFERVGFVCCRAAGCPASDGLLVLAESYEPVDDEDYIPSRDFGALIGSRAIRTALQFSLNNRSGLFHIHMHEHSGEPRPSPDDWTQAQKFVPDFFNATPSMPHGILILSRDLRAFGLCWTSKTAHPMQFDLIQIVGAPMRHVDLQA